MKLALLTFRDADGVDPLAGYREQMLYPMALVGVLVLTPYAVNTFLHDRPGLGLAIVAVVVSLGVDALAIRRKKPPPIPFALLLGPMAATILLSLATQGIYGALWCYPAVIFFYFVLSRREANLCSVALLAAASFAAYLYVGPLVAIRFFVSLGITVILSNIILNVVGELQRRLLEQAITDPLTGAFNRRHMETCLGEALDRNQRSGAPLSLLVADVDFFKRINDELGHEAGDGVLKGVVELLRDRLRRGDRLFRVGGEEFLVLLPDTPTAGAAAAAEQLRAAVAESALLADRAVTVSIGVAEHRLGETGDALIGRADAALYEAKRGGRNRVAMAEPAAAAGAR
jgi:diguanylate cyclase (GGDEF)-like protein